MTSVYGVCAIVANLIALRISGKGFATSIDFGEKVCNNKIEERSVWLQAWMTEKRVGLINSSFTKVAEDSLNVKIYTPLPSA